tara:strand:- start:16601 stop:18025 length:1425 start_codon:yes stop_codon:yes gene_type:complete
MSSLTSLAGYNGTGTQGTAVTDKLDDSVRSVFWNENDTNRALIYGAQLVEAPGGGDDKLGGSKTWVLDNTPDVIGDLFLRIKIKDWKAQNTSLAPATATPAVQFGLLNIIDRIDIKVGSQIWQTLDRNTLYSLLNTELNSEQFNSVAFNCSGGNGNDSAATRDKWYGGYTGQFTAEPEAFIPLLAFTKNYTGTKTSFNSINESGHLYCAAPDQQFTVQLFFSNGKSTWEIAYPDPLNYPISRTNSPFAWVDTLKVETNLYYRQITMSNIERSSIINAPAGIPKRIKLTQEIPNIDLNSAEKVRIDCSRFNLYASHLILNIPIKPVLNLAAIFWGQKNRINFELHINGTSLFGVMPGIAFLNGVPSYYLGVHAHDIYLPDKTVSADPLNKEAIAELNWTYIIPLASTAYGGSSVPLNRFDSIILTISENYTARLAPASSSDPTLVQPYNFGRATLTCVGESVALYKEGAASLATY